MNDITQRLREQQARESVEQPPGINVDLAVLDARRIDLEKPPPKPVPVIRLMGQQICTAGNLTVISAQAKAGKSAVVGVMLATLLSADQTKTDHLDLFGFAGQEPGKKAVVLFDTEQSPYDACSLVVRATARAGMQGLPENFRCYSLADIGIPQRRLLLNAELERAAQKCGGVHCVFIDGVADLCADLNDSQEAFGLVDDLVRLAIKYKCPVVNVLHENPSGKEAGKTRGHLGSQLERKAESNLRVVKDAKGVSTIYSERCRHAAIPKEDAPRFAWNADAGLHTSISTNPKAERQAEERKNAMQAIERAFDGETGSVGWSDLKKKIMEICKVESRSAERRIKRWHELGLLVETQRRYGRACATNRQPPPTVKTTVTVGNRQTVSSYLDS